MPTSRKDAPFATLIPLNSDEPTWEWHIESGAVFFSTGAIRLLKLEPVPENIEQFMECLLPEDRERVRKIRQAIMEGLIRGVTEYDYVCNDVHVHEHFVTLTRNINAVATRVMGRLSHSAPGLLPAPNIINGLENSLTGVWIFHVPSGRIWKDRMCSAILGFTDQEEIPLTPQNTLINVHASERQRLERHYQIFIHDRLLGESITDIVRVRHANGTYIPVMVRASALERDDEGKAILLAGILTPADYDSEKGFRMREERLQKALSSMGVGQWNWDIKENETYFCPRFLAMLGYSHDESITFGAKWRGLVHPDDLAKIEQARKLVIESPQNGDNFECTYRIKDASGKWAWILDRGCVTWRDDAGRAEHMIGSITNITTAQAERDLLEDLVRHDALTGLRSRAFCNLEIEHIEQNGTRPVAVISIDVTGLKMINDNMGHAVGDELLTQAATILQGALRASDFIARTGGDEFLVLLPNCDEFRAQTLLKKIEKAFDDYNDSHDDLPVLVACGAASAWSADTSLLEVIASADTRMYESKKRMRKEAHAKINEWLKSRLGHEAGPDDRLAE